MKSIAWLVLVGCGSAPAAPPSNHPPPDRVPAAHERRCLPVVAKDCGCVYACGIGERGDHDTWTVSHSFWQTPLTAVVERWCVDQACTEAFAAEIVCDGICAPKPADPACHFDGDRCVGTPP